MSEKLKEQDALPLQFRTFRASIVKRVIKRVRAAEVDPAGQDPDDDGDGEGDEEVYDVSLSSETPVDRWYGRETLLHGKDNVNLDRADPKDGLPLLAGHDSRALPIGRIRDIAVKNGELRGTLHPSKSPRGREAATLLDEGHREMSIGYSIDSYECTPGKAGEADEYRATRWTPMEGSMVSVPADPSVGVGRSADGELRFPVAVRHITPAAPASTEVRMSNNAAAADPAANAPPAHVAIARLASQHGMADRTSEWLEKGLTIDQVREAILDAKGTKSPAEIRAGGGTGIDLPEKDRRTYSYARAIASAADMAEGKRAEKCLEIEVSEVLERQMPNSYKRHGGLFIPTSLRGLSKLEVHDGARGSGLPPQLLEAVAQFQRTGVVDSVTANALKEVVFTEYGGELINILRNMALVVRMGARVLTGLSSPIAFPRQTQDATANWVQENSGTDVASSNVKTDLVVLTPRTLQATTAYSRQLLVQSSIDVEAMVRESIAAAHALAWDLAAMHGTGVNNQPLGIYNQPNVSTVDFTATTGYGATGNKISYAGCIEMEVLVATANALLGTLGYITTPNIAGDAKNTLKFPGAAIAQGGPLWEGTLLEGELNGYVARATNQVSKTMGANGAATGGTNHGLIYANWADLLIGQFGGAMEMIVDPYTKKKQGLIEVTSFQMSDVAVRHIGSFAVGTNLAA